MAKKNQPAFLLQKDQKEIIDELTNEEAGIIFKAIYEYEETKEVPKLDKTLRIVFKQFKVKLDSYDDAYEEKCLKNKENIEKYWKSLKENTTEYDGIRSNTMATNKIKENKIKEKDMLSSKLDDQQLIFKEIIACFNKIGIIEKDFVKNKKEFHFKNSKTNQKLIKNILDQGYTKDDIMDVIYLKYDQWIENPDINKFDMSTYYRPSTILGDKFDEYLEEAKMKGIS